MVAAHASLVTTNAEHDQQIRFSTRSSSGSHIECVKNVGGTPKKGLLWKQVLISVEDAKKICRSINLL